MKVPSLKSCVDTDPPDDMGARYPRREGYPDSELMERSQPTQEEWERAYEFALESGVWDNDEALDLDDAELDEYREEFRRLVSGDAHAYAGLREQQSLQDAYLNTMDQLIDGLRERVPDADYDSSGASHYIGLDDRVVRISDHWHLRASMGRDREGRDAFHIIVGTDAPEANVELASDATPSEVEAAISKAVRWLEG